MAGASPCNHIAADHRGGRTEGRSLGNRALLKAVKAGELNPLEVVYLAKDKAGSSADGRYGASLGVVLLHKVHQRPARGQVPGTGHSSGEYDYVVIVNLYACVKGSVRANGNVVGGSDKGFVTYGNQLGWDSSAAEYVRCGKGLDIFKALGQKYKCLFHTANISIISYFCVMEEEKKLYPFKFIPIDEDPRETVLLADLGYQDSLVREGWLAANSISEIMDMYMDRVVGEHVFAWYGRQFPVMARILGGQERTPLMVTPDDETAAQRLDFLGKAKLWYVNGADEGGRIYLGFKEDTSAEDFYYACRDNKVENLLYSVQPKAGDCFFIYPGLVHAAGKGVRITEISECSPLDFRLCNWGKPIEGDDFDTSLGLEAAFDFIDYKKYVPDLHNHAHSHDGGLSTHLTECEEFSVTKLKLTDALHIYSSKFDCFLLYVCLEGEASLQVIFDPEIGPINYTVKEGECILVPAEVPDFFLVPVARNTSLLEVTVEKRADSDAYINPDIQATLPGEEEDEEDFEDDECDCEHEDHECECGHHHHHHHHIS